MKKIFMTMAVAGMVAMVSCGKGDKATDSIQDTNASEVVEETTAQEEVIAIPETADQLEAQMAENGWTLDNEGNIVDKDGNIVKTYQEAMAAYGNVMDEYSKKVSAAMESVKNIPGAEDAVEAANAEAGKAVDKAKEEAQKAVDKAKEEAKKATDKAKEEAKAAMDKAMKNVKF